MHAAVRVTLRRRVRKRRHSSQVIGRGPKKFAVRSRYNHIPVAAKYCAAAHCVRAPTVEFTHRSRLTARRRKLANPLRDGDAKPPVHEPCCRTRAQWIAGLPAGTADEAHGIRLASHVPRLSSSVVFAELIHGSPGPQLFCMPVRDCGRGACRHTTECIPDLSGPAEMDPYRWGVV